MSSATERRAHKNAHFCCCGCCSLSTGTVVAALICAIECAIGLFWNVELWMHLDRKECLGTFDDLVKVSTLKDFDVIRGLVIASTVLHATWVILCAMILRANFALNRGLLGVFTVFVDLQTCFDVGVTIYFGIKFESISPGFNVSSFHDSDNEPTAPLAYFTLMVLFSRGVIIWFLNLYLAHVVQKRGKEIEHNNSLLALYLISHMSQSRNQQRPNNCYNVEQASAAYCHPNYLPKYLVPGCKENLESSWDLNNEVLEGISSFTNPMYPRIDQNSVSEFRPPQASPPPPYIDSENSYRHEGQGVLPY